MRLGRKFGVALALMLFVCSASALTAHPPRVGARRHFFHRKHKPTWFEYRVFVPSHENLLSQNTMINDLGLPRIEDDSALKSLIEENGLVPITQNKFVRISSKLEAKRRYCRPWVDLFLQELGAEYYAQFGEPIQVNSAVRTIKTQSWLLRWNHNAAPAHGDTASAHLAGVAVDLQRRGLTRAQIAFLQRRLLYLRDLHMVIVEEELKQPCFHIVVTGEYPYMSPVKVVMPDISVILSGEVPNANTSQGR